MKELNDYGVAYKHNNGKVEFLYWDCGYPCFSSYSPLTKTYGKIEQAQYDIDRIKSYDPYYVRGHEDFSKIKIVRFGFEFVD